MPVATVDYPELQAVISPEKADLKGPAKPPEGGLRPQPALSFPGRTPTSVRRATTRRELEAIQRLRYQIYVEEEGKVLSSANHETKQLSDLHDESAIHFYIEKAGEVVACVRMHVGFIPEKLAEPLELHRFPGCGQGHDCFISKLMVRKDQRGSMAAARLMRTMYAMLGELGVGMVFCTTFPHLVTMYRRIGLEPYPRMYQDPDFGPHYAMALQLHDFILQSGNASRLPKAA